MRKVFMCEEMKKLRNKLDRMGIAWEDRSDIRSDERIKYQSEHGIPEEFADLSIFRTHFLYKGVHFSVINGWGTYGGYDAYTDTNAGLLEVMYSDKEIVVGCLTADAVISLMKSIT